MAYKFVMMTDELLYHAKGGGLRTAIGQFAEGGAPYMTIISPEDFSVDPA
jgi:hypothetical protein